jgi:Bacterial alpha-L-rhamnosidase 6 hairpin glycosidase domain/Bacterial alpha-L-rhamnosidase C-terminal domain
VIGRFCAGVAASVAAAVLLVPSVRADNGAGSFASSDPLLDRIWSASVRTAQDMLVPGPLTVDAEGRPCAIDVAVAIIDGVVRDRCPYVGDEAVTDRTLDASTPNWPVQRAMLLWFAKAQHGDGAIPASPLDGANLVLIDYNAYWVQALYTYVLYSGDVDLAREVWPNLVRLLDIFYPAHTRSGLLVNDFGPSDYAFVRRRGDVVAYYNAQYVYALRQAAQLARWLGRTDAAARWSARAAATSAATDAAFWDAGAGAFSDTTEDRSTHPQDANAFAILAGVATHAQAISALDYLAGHDWRGYGNTIVDTQSWDNSAWGWQANDRVYPFISYFELVARFELGLDSSAFDLLRREWGYMVEYGPGTMWETIGPYGGPPTDIHPSYDSGWSSGAAPALTEYVLGVAPTSPGFATFTVTPHPDGLTRASGDVPTPHGPVHVSWHRVGSAVFLKVSAPSGTTWTNQRAS